MIMMDDQTAKKQFPLKNNIVCHLNLRTVLCLHLSFSSLYFLLVVFFKFFFFFSFFLTTNISQGIYSFSITFKIHSWCSSPYSLVFSVINLFFNFSKYSFGFTAIVQVFALAMFSVQYRPICFFLSVSRILNCSHNSSERPKLFIVSNCFKNI